MPDIRSTVTLSTAPVITIYVRHSDGCRYASDEFSRRCSCRKHLRWTHNGKQRRRKANTRSWAEAEEVKRDLADQLSGKEPEPKDTGRDISSAADVFIAAKEVEGLTPDLIGKYRLWLGRLASYCEAQSVFTVQGITGEIIIGFCKSWEQQYPSALTRSKLRERYKSFMRFCQSHGWITRVPEWPKIQSDGKAPTLPLTAEQYTRLLDSVYVIVKAPEDAVVENQTYTYWVKRVHGLFQLMRWSGLSIMDALTLPRAELFKRDGDYRVVTQRTKTGTDVSVVIPPEVAAELLAIPNDNDRYFFWSGVGSKKSICGNWGKRFVVPAFDEAGIEGGHMKSHRLRDTFACDLLEKGVALEDVSKLLGHRSIKTTEKHYAAWVKTRQSRLDNVVRSTWEASGPRKARPGRKRLTAASGPASAR
jgi:site-specific recombinase XerD